MSSAEHDRDVKMLLNRLGTVLGQLESKGVSKEEALGFVRLPDGVPLSIFNSKLGTLESIVKYLREEAGMSYAAIAEVLGRNQGPVGVTYRRSLTKMKSRLDLSSDVQLPFEVLRSRKLSVLESIAYHLAKQGHSWHEIASIMHRHDKTIWTVLDRAKSKMAKRKTAR
ncbi:hypothetical protein KY362_07165 [Candidatus Woesearchaeota archaeon]|nr:hypothetical protein [Candidatus Woesearchaeota archaeon]